VVVSGGACLGPTMNNVAEYSIMIELLRDVIVHGISCLEVLLDSQLVVLQLNGQYHVHDPTLLDDSYGYIFWNDILIILLIFIFRSENFVSDAYANYVLDWNLSHI
jgi:hypothetical protein